MFIFLFFFSFFFFFYRHNFFRPISLEPLLAETPNGVCCLVLRSSCALLLTIQFASLFFLIFFFIFCRQDFVWAISLEPLLAETPNLVCCLVLQSYFALLLTIQFASLIFFCFVFSATILSGPYLWNRYSQRLQILCAAWSSGLILPLLLTIQFASLISSLINIISLLLTTFDWTKVRGIAPRSHTGQPRTCLIIIITSDPRRGCYIVLSMFIFFLFFLFSNFFRHDFVRPISLEPLLAETPNSVCCLVLRSSTLNLKSLRVTVPEIWPGQNLGRKNEKIKKKKLTKRTGW